MTGDAVTLKRRVQGLESSGKDRQTGECTNRQEPYGYTSPSSFEEPDQAFKSHENVKKNVVDGDEKNEKRN
jgi:hypothetical protein